MTTPEEDARLAAEGWIQHDGTGMPVDMAKYVEVRHGDAAETVGPAGDWLGWRWSDEAIPANHITHYRVLTPVQAEPATRRERVTTEPERGPLQPSEAHLAALDLVRTLAGQIPAPDALTIRDQMAMAALTGILAGGFADTVPHDDINGGRDAAAFAYAYADAMLAERAGK